MIQVKIKWSVMKDATLLRDQSSIFPTMCIPTMRTSFVPHSIIFFFPCTCPPFYIFLSFTSPHHGLIFMIIGLKGKQPLEEFLSLTILVFISLAIRIAPPYMIYERLVGGESLWII
jgi:hypothetical protein